MTVDARDAVLNLANWLRWVTETNGSNRGEAVDAIIRVTGLDPANRLPWCAAFVAACGYAVLREKWPLKKVAGCVSLYEDAFTKGLVRNTTEKGSIFLLWSPTLNRYHHTGFVVGPWTGTLWTTIEGNTNIDGSPEGTGVFQRTRSFNGESRFIQWW
ncbi:MAG TPA: hypothetical protein VM487_12990 [Phycisphaerae bacterium]|nr:hypothetical protein [Phycisphaerae bacterium]